MRGGQGRGPRGGGSLGARTLRCRPGRGLGLVWLRELLFLCGVCFFGGIGFDSEPKRHPGPQTHVRADTGAPGLCNAATGREAEMREEGGGIRTSGAWC